MATKSLLKVRKNSKSRKHRFKRQELGRQLTLDDKWRKPRGHRAKLRMREKARGRMPTVGYRSPVEVRGLNRAGYREVIVSTPKQLDKIKPKEEAAVISATVGKKKRFEILVLADKKGIKVTNA